MKVEIKSNGQSGGITAHTVSMQAAPAPVPASVSSTAAEKRFNWRMIAGWTSAAVAFAASLVAIVDYLGIKP